MRTRSSLAVAWRQPQRHSPKTSRRRSGMRASPPRSKLCAPSRARSSASSAAGPSSRAASATRPSNGSSRPRGTTRIRPSSKRTALERDGVGMIDLAALCQSEQPACDRLLDDFRQQHELAQAAARPERVTIDVRIALDDHERLRVQRLLAEEGMAAEIRFTDVLKMVMVPTLDDGGRVLLWTAVYEFDGADYVLARRAAAREPRKRHGHARDASSSGSRFGFSLASLVAQTAE